MIERLDAAMRAGAPDAVLSEFSWIGAAIDDDAAHGRFDRWGRSTVIDENTGEPVITEAVFAALHARANLPASWPVGNAGLLHVYGYLTSTAATPYGLKRERWLGSDLALACGLDADAFVPWIGERTLLERATSALATMFEGGDVHRERVGDVDAAIALRPAAGLSGSLGYAVAGRYITMFPVADVDAIRRDLTDGPPRLRWNAVA